MALRLDPEALPVIGVDHHLPAVAEAELTVAALRRRFSDPPGWAPEPSQERSRPDLIHSARAAGRLSVADETYLAALKL